MMLFFYFNDTAPTEIYTLSLHDALPIWCRRWRSRSPTRSSTCGGPSPEGSTSTSWRRGCRFSSRPSPICLKKWLNFRSEEHTSELQSQSNLVCRLLLEKKKKNSHAELHLDC